MRFVVHEHFARTHHFDFRLEHAGVLKSWAIPKGPSTEPGVRRLAMQVEDHDLAFADFEGEIPEGQYGAGTIQVWDRGTYDLRTWTGERIEVTLHGSRLQGDFVLVRFRQRGEREWLMYKRSC